MLIDRPIAAARVQAAYRVHQAIALLGPRQCGKTTLAHIIADKEPDVSFFDLEKAVDQRRLETPEQTLSRLTGLVVIDEVQKLPQLFEVLRVLLYRPDSETRFLLLGCASPSLIKRTSETLAGRIGLVDLSGFDMNEIPSLQWQTLWQRGGFPRSFLASDDAASALWRENFIRTFLERDIPQLGITIPAETLRRFWRSPGTIHPLSATICSIQGVVELESGIRCRHDLSGYRLAISSTFWASLGGACCVSTHCCKLLIRAISVVSSP